jgi:RNA polymerase sigma-70 factor (ECF subfamily)
MADITQIQARLSTLEEPSDDTLVKAALRDTAQFASLYRRYAARIYRYCYSRTGCQARAEDLTSQVFLDALKNLPHYRSGSHFSAWLFAIAYRRVVDTYRTQSPSIPFDEELYPSEATDPMAGLLQTEQRNKLNRLISPLTTRDQELLRLRYSAGLSISEIAKVIGKREGAVKMALSRLIHRMKEQWEVMP